jgi:prephenate dehydratase
MSTRYAYLGPEGTFTEVALRQLRPEARTGDLLPCPSVDAVFAAVRGGDVAGGVVPLENSVEGGVTSTLAELINGEPLLIAAEEAVEVQFSLLARPGVDLADVKRVVTHPHAQAQCRGWLWHHLPDAQTFTSPSTAAAAQLAAEPGSDYDAAIASRTAGEHYGLVPIAEGLADRSGAATRFVYLTRPGELPAPTGHDRTSLVAFLSDDHPGALVKLLDQFAVRGVNLTRLESRPTGDALGNYCFCIDAEGHVADAALGEALMGLRRICKDVRFLGSYPRTDANTELEPFVASQGTSNADFAEAAAWLERIRAGQVD